MQDKEAAISFKTGLINIFHALDITLDQDGVVHLDHIRVKEGTTRD